MMQANRMIMMATIVVMLMAHVVTGCIHDKLNHKVIVGEQTYPDAHPFLVAERARRRQRHRRLEVVTQENTMLVTETIEASEIVQHDTSMKDKDAHFSVETDLAGDQPLNPDGKNSPNVPRTAFSAQAINTQEYDRVEGQAAADNAYNPIRITPVYDSTTFDLLSSDKKAILYKIIPDAIERFRRTLSVVSVQGNLMAKRTCAIQWVTKPTVCKSFVQTETCLEMSIPDSHLAPTRVCSKCLTAGCTQGDCTTTSGEGVPNSDFVLYIRAANSSYCTGSVLAYASSCQKDQFDRPTFGMANFCPLMIKTDPREYQNQLSTAMHEMTHALGFSAQYFPYMRDPTGTPRTPRDANGMPPVSTSTTCPNGQSSSYFVQPDVTTVKFTNERDESVARMVTPRVAAFVQEHFGCNTLEGAELESQDDGCLGSHWEERIFEPEYMTPVSSFRNVYSSLTLAFFEDSGWYKTNASMVQRLHFGAKRGCSFANDKCITKSTGVSIAPDHFCTSSDVESCSVDATSRSVCAITTGKSIPSAYQYFSDPTRGGTNDYADFCPLNSGYSFGDCTDPANLVSPTGTTLNILGETYCPTCKCTASTLRSSDSKKWVVSSRRATGCYSMRCPTPTSVELSIPVVGDNGGNVIKVLCTNKGDKLSVDGYSGTLTCPDPSIVCDRTCPQACSGNGYCDFTTAICSCNKGWIGDDCATNATAPVQINLRKNGGSRQIDSNLFVLLLLGTVLLIM